MPDFKHYKSTKSTNDSLKSLLKTNTLSDFSCVTADFQSTGKGMGKNQWVSETGKNALFSILIKNPEIPAENQFIISKMVSLAIVDFLSSHTKNIFIKWPNDIYVDSKKIAGILIEASIKGSNIENVIIGVGLNLNQERFPADLPNAISLKQITGAEYDVAACINDIHKIILNYFNTSINASIDSIDSIYLNNLYKINVECSFTANNKAFTGVIKGVNEYGQLLIETENTIRIFSFKEVEYLY